MPKKDVDQSPDQFAASLPEGLSAAPATTEEGGSKRENKLTKDFPEDRISVVIITIKDGARGAMEFDVADLPEAIANRLPAFGLGHKLGDSASGKKGTEAEDAIIKTFEAMKVGEWAVKGTPAPRVSLKEVTGNLANLPDEEKAKAIETLKLLGIKIPGVTEEAVAA